jgi:Raf kinase inhibitor-like YbhB/YbcL family protein
VKSPDPYSFLPEVPVFVLRSNDISDGHALPLAQRSGIFGSPGEDRSPHLTWQGHPAGTRSFVVTCYDADAPTGRGFWHWTVYDVPALISELPAGAGDEGGASLPAGAKMPANDAGLRKYLGASPPPGHGSHRYFFVVHAVDTDSMDIECLAGVARFSSLRSHTSPRHTDTYLRGGRLT